MGKGKDRVEFKVRAEMEASVFVKSFTKGFWDAMRPVGGVGAMWSYEM